MNANWSAEKCFSECGRAVSWAVLLLPLGVLGTVASHSAYSQESTRSGREIVEAVCANCHTPGTQGAPKIGDASAWSKRAAQGLEALTKNALEGIRKMPAHGAKANLTDLEIQRAITYMVNASGGRWVEPASAKDLAKERSGEQVVKAQCAKCHEPGTGGAPRIGDNAAWNPRMKQGVETLVRSAIRGHAGMPPRGGQANLSDTELRSAVMYMFNPAGANAPQGAAAKAVPTGGNEKVVGRFKIFLGVTPAEALMKFPADSKERAMHGGVPKEPGFHHLNVSVFDRTSSDPVRDLTVEARIERPGLGGDTKKLEAISAGAASYGAYVKAIAKTPYQVIVRIRAPGSPSPVEARFEHTF